MSATSSKLKNPNDSVMNQRVIKLAWPIFLQLLLGISLGYVDTIMLSNYNETAVGAIGNANQVLGFLTLAFNIISSATGIIVSQYLGAGKKEKMNMIYTVALSFNLVLSIVISFVVFIFSRNLLEAMQVPAAMLDESDMYMRIVGGTIFTQALINAFNSIFASNGKTVFGMIIGLGMNIINICGNALLLYGPLQVLGLGASGAAVSTCGSRVIAVIASTRLSKASSALNIFARFRMMFSKAFLNSAFRQQARTFPTTVHSCFYRHSLTQWVSLQSTQKSTLICFQCSHI